MRACLTGRSKRDWRHASPHLTSVVSKQITGQQSGFGVKALRAINPSSSVGKAGSLIARFCAFYTPFFSTTFCTTFGALGNSNPKSNQQFGHRTVWPRHHSKTEFPDFLAAFFLDGQDYVHAAHRGDLFDELARAIAQAFASHPHLHGCATAPSLKSKPECALPPARFLVKTGRRFRSLLPMRKLSSACVKCIYQRHSLAGSCSEQLVRSRYAPWANWAQAAC